MITLTRINRVPLVLNSDLIEYVETTPDTVVSLTSGLKLLVLESPAEILNKVVVFRQNILKGLPESICEQKPYVALSAALPRLSKEICSKE